MKGVYAVFFRLSKKKKVNVGAIGEREFPSGVYVYVGSAMTNVEKRIERHFSETQKKHWHIDYFSEEADSLDALIFERESSFECVLAEIFSNYGKGVSKFGCSDCGCSSHLFRLNNEIAQSVNDD